MIRMSGNRSGARQRLLLVVASAALAACGGDGGGNGTPDGGPGPGDGGPPVDCNVTPALCVGADGGTVTSADGNVSLVVPAGALDTPTNITVTAVTGGSGLGPDYEFGPDGLQFATPATVTRTFTLSELPGFGVNDVYYTVSADLTSGGTTEPLDNVVTDADLSAGTVVVTAEVPHFSTLRFTRGHLDTTITGPFDASASHQEGLNTLWNVTSSLLAVGSTGTLVSLAEEMVGSPANTRTGTGISSGGTTLDSSTPLLVAPDSGFTCGTQTTILDYSLTYVADLTPAGLSERRESLVFNVEVACTDTPPDCASDCSFPGCSTHPSCVTPPSSPWTVTVPAGGSTGAVNITVDDTPTNPPTLAGTIAMAQVTVDQPTLLTRPLSAVFDATGQTAPEELMMYVSYDGGASWNDALAVLSGAEVEGQAFLPEGSFFVAAVREVTQWSWTASDPAPAPLISTADWVQLDTELLDFTGTDPLGHGADVNAVRRHRRIDDGSGDTVLELDVQLNSFEYPRFQGAISCQDDTLVVTDVSEDHTARFADSSLNMVGTNQRGDRLVSGSITDGSTTRPVTATLRTAQNPANASETGLYLLSHISGLPSGAPEREDSLVDTVFTTSHFFAADPQAYRFGDRLLFAELHYSERFAEPGSALLFRSVRDKDPTKWTPLRIPGAVTFTSTGTSSHQVLGARVVGDHLAVLVQRFAEAPGCSFPPPLTRSLQLFIYDRALRVVAEREILDVGVEHGGGDTFSDANIPTNFFLARETAGGFELIITGSQATAENATALSCSFPGDLSEDQALVYFSATVSGDQLTLSATPSNLSVYPDLLKHRPSYSSSHFRSCRLANGGIEGARRYVWNDDYLALGVDRCRLSNQPQGAVVFFTADGSSRLQELPTDLIPELTEGDGGRLMVTSAVTAFGTPAGVQIDVAEAHVFEIDPAAPSGIVTRMLTNYPPRRPESNMTQTEDCQHVYRVCGDRILCVRLDTDEVSSTANDALYTSRRVFLQLLGPAGGASSGVGVDRQQLNNGEYYINTTCPMSGSFEWDVPETSATPATTTAVEQQCCRIDPMNAGQQICEPVPMP